MPLYEFICKKCARQFERLVRLGQEQDVCCLNCGSRDVRKLFSSFGIGGGSSRIKSPASCASCSSASCSTCK